jgi:hypothetical protein
MGTWKDANVYMHFDKKKKREKENRRRQRVTLMVKNIAFRALAI